MIARVLKQILYFLVFAARNILDAFISFEEISILVYHSISDARTELAVPPEKFERHIQALQERGYHFASLADVLCWVRQECDLPRKSVALTFDDGYVDFKTNVIPMLEKYNIPATLFVMGDPAASRGALANDIPLLSKEDVPAIGSHSLVTLGYHSRTHKNLSTLTGEDLRTEVLPPFKTNHFAYPGGNHASHVAQAVRAAGFVSACTIRPGLVSRHENPFFIPRSVVLSSMPLWHVLLRAQKSIDWYQALRVCWRSITR